MTITVETMKQVLDAFNRHDLDAIMEFFAEDCSFDFPRGPEPWGQRFVGKAQVREALASRDQELAGGAAWFLWCLVACCHDTDRAKGTFA